MHIKNMLQFLLTSAHGRVPCKLGIKLQVKLVDKEEIIANTQNCTIVLI